MAICCVSAQGEGAGAQGLREDRGPELEACTFETRRRKHGVKVSARLLLV